MIASLSVLHEIAIITMVVHQSLIADKLLPLIIKTEAKISFHKDRFMIWF